MKITDPDARVSIKDELYRQIADTVLATGRPVEVISGDRRLYTVHPGGRLEIHP